MRVDLVPGKTVELTFTPDRAGRFVFLCDNFCGEGHDRMTGFLVVTEDKLCGEWPGTFSSRRRAHSPR